jgi:hypothetical protein
MGNLKIVGLTLGTMIVFAIVCFWLFFSWGNDSNYTKIIKGLGLKKDVTPSTVKTVKLTT